MSDHIPTATTVHSSFEYQWSVLYGILNALVQVNAIPNYCTTYIADLDQSDVHTELFFAVCHKEPQQGLGRYPTVFTARISNSAQPTQYVILDGYPHQGKRLHYSFENAAIPRSTIHRIAVQMTRQCA